MVVGERMEKKNTWKNIVLKWGEIFVVIPVYLPNNSKEKKKKKKKEEERKKYKYKYKYKKNSFPLSLFLTSFQEREPMSIPAPSSAKPTSCSYMYCAYMCVYMSLKRKKEKKRAKK